MKAIKITTLKHINKKRGTWDGYYVIMNDDGFLFVENSPLAVSNCKGTPSILGLIFWIICDSFGLDYIKLCAYFRRFRRAGHV